MPFGVAFNVNDFPTQTGPFEVALTATVGQDAKPMS